MKGCPEFLHSLTLRFEELLTPPREDRTRIMRIIPWGTEIR
jgi:hypothetical protein